MQMTHVPILSKTCSFLKISGRLVITTAWNKARQIELFWRVGFLGLYEYTLKKKKYGYLISENKSTFFWNFVPNFKRVVILVRQTWTLRVIKWRPSSMTLASARAGWTVKGETIEVVFIIVIIIFKKT